MKKTEELLQKTLSELEMKEVEGGKKWGPGPSMIWGGIMDAATGGCSWGGLYSKPLPSGGTCARR